MKLNFSLPLLAVMFALSACKQETSPQNPPAPASPAATNAAPAPVAAKSAFEKLVGRWERPDGGYVLELKSVDAEGKVAAGYFNPSPINVERAIATTEAGALKVFVLLRDENYPGCTYKLTYDAATDQLFGQYFQASQQETYDITFARQK
ncbi:MAG: hypothetical protein NTZ16_05785 [Verrucomicrobia bacterium]|nr:hypothetical protein [Verrucomicrobiota bacterium]